ncbi:MAG: hypothetical protein AAF500_11465 [Myxococcota bacterium]
MKRSLEVLGEAPSDATLPATRRLRVGRTEVSIIEAGDGTATARLAALLQDVGAEPLSNEDATMDDANPLRVMLRARTQGRDAAKRAAALEGTADVILGAPRPGFAHWLVRTLSER